MWEMAKLQEELYKTEMHAHCIDTDGDDDESTNAGGVGCGDGGNGGLGGQGAAEGHLDQTAQISGEKIPPLGLSSKERRTVWRLQPRPR